MMDYAQMQKHMRRFLMIESEWKHASFFMSMFAMHHHERVYDATVRKLCKSIRHAQVGLGETVLSTIEDGYLWSADTGAILDNANYWRQKALSRLQTASDIKAAVSSSQESLVL